MKSADLYVPTVIKRNKKAIAENVARVAIRKLLHETPWYGTVEGCNAMAVQILALSGKGWQIVVKCKKD